MSRPAKLLLISVLILLALGGTLFASGETEKAAVEFPKEKAIRLLNPYAAGGATDIAARILAGVAPELIEQRIDVISMPGAGGQEAINFVLAQPRDGYALLVTDYGPLITTALSDKVNYKLEDWVPVMQISETGNPFFVRADSPITSIDDWLAKARANPGSLSIAHGRYLAPPHLPLILLEQLTGTKNNHIPTTGGAEALSFVLGGQVDMGVSVPSTIVSSVKAGQLRALAIASATRSQTLPDTPTLKELGYDVVLPFWFMIFAHKDVPRERVQFLSEKFIEAMQNPAAKTLAQRAGVEVVLYGADESAGIYKNTVDNLAKVLAATKK
jgi:tripartite-type tricarboxylate transporter receptor subunit TctC